MSPAYVSAMLAALVWGISPILERSVLMHAPPLPCLVIRCIGTALGGLLLLPFISDLRTAWQPIGTMGIFYLLAAGALASVLGQVFMYRALTTAEVSAVSPVAGSWPLLALVFGALFLGEPMTAKKVAGCLLTVAGVWLLKF